MFLQKVNRLGLVAGAVFLAGCVAEGGPNYRPPTGSGSLQPQTCPMVYAPVCGERRGERKSLSNSCVAQAEGYRVISTGQCSSSKPGSGWGGEGTRPTRPPQQSQRPVRPGGSSGACTREYRPVCAQRGGDRQTFANSCSAENAGYRIVRNGQCR